MGAAQRAVEAWDSAPRAGRSGADPSERRRRTGVSSSSQAESAEPQRLVVGWPLACPSETQMSPVEEISMHVYVHANLVHTLIILFSEPCEFPSDLICRSCRNSEVFMVIRIFEEMALKLAVVVRLIDP